jgi:two-component system, chemotaxis family, CheB/CheR fusion protein
MPDNEQPAANDPGEVFTHLHADEITPAGTGFLIAGMGASAGGLEAFNKFFDHMPPDSGMAFVLVMHLSPDLESQVAEIIARHTQMPVHPAEDGMRVEQDHVYVIRPNTTLTLWDGVLHVTEPAPPRGQRMPIDEFFASLAEAQGRNAVCIVLSGTGSDGTQGLKAIKEMGGMAMTQVGARYHDMPRSARATGLGDYDLSVEEMPARLLEYGAHLGHVDNQDVVDRLRRNERRQLSQILMMLRAQSGHDFSQYKETTVIRRIERRMQVTQSATPEQYIDHVRTVPAELGYLFDDMLINVTQFMRDPEAFQTLAQKTLPELCAAKPQGDRVRIWVAGCATGEEAYSIAMLFLDEMSRGERNIRLQVFATDIDARALAAARAGIYPEFIIDQLMPRQLERYFRKLDHGYEVLKALREPCIFSKHDLIRDPPFSRMDLISCRNVLIYMTPTLQKRLLSVFHYALKPGGVLLLGPSETISGFEDLFEPIDRKQRIFRRREAATPRLHLPMGRSPRVLNEGEQELVSPRPMETEIPRQVERYVLDQYAPPYVVVNDRYETIYFSGGMGQYLEPPAGAPDRNVLNMARHGLRMHLRAAIDEAKRSQSTVVKNEIHVKTSGDYQTMRLTVRPVSRHGETTDYYTIIFEPAAPPPDEHTERAPQSLSQAEDRTLVQQLEEELRSTRQQLQTTIEDLEAANEELKTANEELMSSNEELHRNNDELARANSDIKNLFDNTQIAMMFLDKQLRIRSLTPRMSDLYHLRPSDTGRAITDIRPKHDYGDLEADVARVLKTLTPTEHTVHTPAGEHMMRILPYRTLDDRIDGVVVTFFDITNLAQARAEIAQLVQARARRAGELETMLALLPIGVAICNDIQTEDVRLNARAAEILGVEDTTLSLRGGPTPFTVYSDDRVLSAEEWPIARALRSGEPVHAQSLCVERADGTRRDIEKWAWPTFDEGHQVSGAISIFNDVTERNREVDLWKAQQSALAELGLFALSENDMAVVQQRVINRLCEVLDTALCEVWQLDAAGERLSLVARSGGATDDLQEHTIVAEADNLVGYALTSEEPVVVVADAATEQRFSYPAHLRSQGMARSMSVAVREGRLLWGVLTVHDRRSRQFLPYDTNFLQSVAHLLGGVLRRKQLEIGHGEAQRKQAFAEAEDRMRQAERLASLGTLAAGIAHEVNNPLNAILMNAELGLVTLRSVDKAEKLKRLLDTIIKEAKRGGSITRNVLQFSKADHYTPKGAADLNGLMQRVRGHVASVLQKHDATLELELDPRLPRIELNQIALEQAMVNLISNAAQSGAARVTVRTEAEPKHVRVTVSDNGMGIPPEQIEHIFDPFYTTRRSKGGSGLGLSLVHRIVSDHDGTIEAHSGQHQGARFVMRLPLSQQEGKSHPSRAER